MSILKDVFSYTDFSGGMNRKAASNRLPENQYQLIINGRTRYSDIRPIHKPKNLKGDIPTGRNMQTIFAASPFLFVFIDGVPYYKNFQKDPDGNFERLSSFEPLDRDIDRIYVESVPRSISNLRRTTRNFNDIEQGVALGVSTKPSPQAIICQDGINQPRLIYDGLQVKIAQTLAQWESDGDPDLDNREYIPIGKQMLYHGNILYIVSPDGLELFRSVSGRPLDFVVAIKEDGDHLSPLEDGLQEASRLSHRIGYSAITNIGKLTSPLVDPSLTAPMFVSTGSYSWAVIPDYQRTVFGEPLFNNFDLFPTGPVSDSAFINILGDSVFVDESGIRSFNAVRQLGTEGENSVFSAQVDDLFEGIVQEDPTAILFDNYAYIAVETIFGQAVLVYDTINQNYAGIDLYSNVTGRIKQFAELKVNGERKLFFITDDGNLFEAFADEEIETCKVYTREKTIAKADAEYIPQKLNVKFRDVASAGTVRAQVFVDKRGTVIKNKTVTPSGVVGTVPKSIPENDIDNNATDTLPFTFIDSTRRGGDVAVYIEFDFEAKLSRIEVEADMQTKPSVTTKQASRMFTQQ